MKATNCLAAVLLVLGMVILFAFFGLSIGMSHLAYEEYSDFPTGPFFGLYCGAGAGLAIGIFLSIKILFTTKADYGALIDTPPTGPYVYRETLPGSSLRPPRRVRDFDVNGSNIVSPGRADGPWIIYYPGLLPDGNASFVYWDTGKEQWLWKAAGYGPYTPVNDTLGEELAMALLVYFDLLENSGEYPPQRLRVISPERLLQAGSAKVVGGIPEA